MDANDPTLSSVKSTPAIEQLELPASAVSFLRMFANQLVEDHARPYKVRALRAFAVCLALADDDPHRAMQYLDALLRALKDWNAMLDEKHAMEMPFP